MSSTPIEPSVAPSETMRTSNADRAETPAEYIGRLLGYVEGKDPRAVLEATPSRLRGIVQQTSVAVLRRQPAPGKWSAAQIIAHLADSEVVFSWRLRAVLGHNGSPLQAFDQDEWATHLAYEKADPAESVELLQAMRIANLRLLDRVEPKLHENYGMHSERGKETITHLIRLYAGHDENHLRQLERLVR